ncbi:hypothetical protein Lser_V15G33627 [Lactuca serriola]
MSDHVPFHIQQEILKRLPVKSLISFRSVSKAWKSFIDSSDFITAHSLLHVQPQHLLLRHRDWHHPLKKINVSLFSEATFPQQRFVQTCPRSIRRFDSPKIIGSSHGLLCVHDSHSEVVVWNPSIRKSISIQLPSMRYDRFLFFLSFGVCPVTLDPKIIKITQFGQWCEEKRKISKYWKVIVYTFSSGEWRKLSNNKERRKSVLHRHTGPQVIIDRFIYWSALYPPRPQYRNLIMSFDMTNESFEVIDLPHNLACHPHNQLSISKLRESLVILESSNNMENKLVFVVWKMEHNVQRSFTKLFTIEAQHESIMKVLGFRESGQPVMEVKDDVSKKSKLVVYEPNSKNFSDLEINGVSDEFYVNSYEETLLLLDRSDCISY